VRFRHQSLYGNGLQHVALAPQRCGQVFLHPGFARNSEAPICCCQLCWSFSDSLP
jgi:hypothetical protein